MVRITREKSGIRDTGSRISAVSPTHTCIMSESHRRVGEMAEWLKAHAWKACLGETLTWVRIPLSPPENQRLANQPNQFATTVEVLRQIFWGLHQRLRASARGSDAARAPQIGTQYLRQHFLSQQYGKNRIFASQSPVEVHRCLTQEHLAANRQQRYRWLS